MQIKEDNKKMKFESLTENLRTWKWSLLFRGMECYDDGEGLYKTGKQKKIEDE